MNIYDIISRIVTAINTGVPIFNIGDAKGCVQVYRLTASQIIIDCERLSGNDIVFVRSSLQQALSTIQSNRMSSEEEAWVLRNAFDIIIDFGKKSETNSGSKSVNSNDNNCNNNDSKLSKYEYESLISFTSSSQENSWFELHDGVMGGVSEGKITFDKNLDCIHFVGVIRQEYNGGFSSIRKAITWDLSPYLGIFIDIDTSRDPSNNRSYGFCVKDNLSREGYFKTVFTCGNNGIERKLLFFKDFQAQFRGMPIDRPPLDKSHISEVSIIITKPPIGIFHLSIYNIGAFS